MPLKAARFKRALSVSVASHFPRYGDNMGFGLSNTAKPVLDFHDMKFGRSRINEAVSVRKQHALAFVSARSGYATKISYRLSITIRSWLVLHRKVSNCSRFYALNCFNQMG